MGFPGGTRGKEPTCQCRRHETWVQSLDWEDSLEEGMATYSSNLAWRIPWTAAHQAPLSVCTAKASPLGSGSKRGCLMEESVVGGSGILQARILEWAVISFSRGFSQPRDQTHMSYVSTLVGGSFTTSVTWEACLLKKKLKYICRKERYNGNTLNQSLGKW